MRFAIDFPAAAGGDFGPIFDRLFASYAAFGEATGENLNHAARHAMDIRKAADGLASSLERRRSIAPLRHVTSANRNLWPSLGVWVKFRAGNSLDEKPAHNRHYH